MAQRSRREGHPTLREYCGRGRSVPDRAEAQRAGSGLLNRRPFRYRRRAAADSKRLMMNRRMRGRKEEPPILRKQADPKLKTLLEQIAKEALESSSNLADVLPKCIAWGSRRGSEALREWATHELHQRRPCGHRTSVGYRRDFATHPIPETQAGFALSRDGETKRLSSEHDVRAFGFWRELNGLNWSR